MKLKTQENDNKLRMQTVDLKYYRYPVITESEIENEIKIKNNLENKNSPILKNTTRYKN